MFIDPIYLIYMQIEDLVINNLQGLIYNKSQPNPTKKEYLTYRIQ